MEFLTPRPEVYVLLYQVALAPHARWLASADRRIWQVGGERDSGRPVG